MSLPNRLATLHQTLRQSLWSAGIDTADLDARLIIRNHTGYDWGDLVAHPEAKIDARQLMRIEFDIERRLSGEPVSRIFGKREFWGIDFKICPDTLDPRPDTETMVEVALERFKADEPVRILDLGIGSGCILITLLTEWPNATGVGVDKAYGAIRTAMVNARNSKVEDRCNLYCGSWGMAVNDSFDLIVSNPPYIPNQSIESLSREVKNHDPILALAGGEDGLDCFRAVVTETKRLLKVGGIGLIEIGYDQQDDVTRLVEESGLTVLDVHPDLAGQPRVVEISHGDK